MNGVYANSKQVELTLIQNILKKAKLHITYSEIIDQRNLFKLRALLKYEPY